MNLKITLWILLVGGIILPLNSQKLFFSCVDLTSPSRYDDFFELNLSDCSYELICNYQPYEHFAIRPVTQEWVSIEWVGVLGWYKMNQCNKLNYGGTILATSPFFDPSLESDKFGNIWLFGTSGIAKINPPSLLYDFKGPIDLITYGIGRATFLDGKYYAYANLNKVPSSEDVIVEFDTLNPMITRIVGSLPDSLLLGGIFALHVSCGDNRLILSNKNEFYEMNIQTGALKFICSLNNFPSHYSDVYAGSSVWSYNPKDCDVFLDLDINNSSGDMKNGFITNYDCRNILPSLSDIDPDVFSDYGIMDSICITILNPLDGIQEEIIYQNGNDIIGKINANKISLIPGLNTTNDSFKLTLQSLKYRNNSCIISNGDRFIQFIAFKNGISDTAYCTLHVNGPFYFAGNDNELRVCKNTPAFSLFKLLGSCYTPNGFWMPSLNNQGIYDPSSNTDSVFMYIVGDSICGYDSAMVKITFDELPLLQLPSDSTLCEGDSIIFSFNMKGVQYLWSNGSNSPQFIIKNPGLYWLEVSNSSQCKIRDSILVLFQNNTKINKDISICSNQSFSFKAKSYNVGDIIFDTIRSQTSCDSLFEFHIIGIPIPTPELLTDTLICKGAETTISTDKTYSLYRWSTNENSQNIKVKSGYYALTVTDQNNCTNTVSITIHEAPDIQYDIESYNPMCNDDNGKIVLNLKTGGIPPFRYFLNGSESKNGVFDNLSSGTYVSDIMDFKGCSKFDTIIILPVSALNISIADKIELESGSSVVIKYIILGGTVKLISFYPNQNISQEGIDGFRITAKEDVTYEIQFEDNNGCIIYRTIKIIINKNNNLYIPNVFSPNGDNINDFWEPYIGTEFELIQCNIFNRWGELVHSSNSKASWDGKFRNENCLPGVYIYSIELKDLKSQLKNIFGEFTLIR